ncbi:MAG: molybdate ABC transporter substrate-binding protein [Nannocystaceae bacterium]|nr:molybdate ABC transporter substrate-binding protein [bacterium]
MARLARGALALCLIAACHDSDATRTVSVFAASSLTEAFEALEPGFEAAHPDTDLQLVFGGSQVLRLQIEQGAPADAFASADAAHVDALARAGRIARTQHFATNHLAVIVPPNNPAGIARLDDLPQASRIVLGTQEVPIGRYTAAMLARVGEDFSRRVGEKVASRESNVRLVRAKVELSEADAAVVYRTDVNTRVRAVPVPSEYDVPARYVLGVAEQAQHPSSADAFVSYVLSAQGRAVLTRHGFDVPASGGAEEAQ